MPLPNAKDKLIQMGSFCNVIFYDEDNTKKTVGLVSNASYNEDFGVMPAKVLGFFGAISLDAQDYTCSLTLGTYVPLDPRAPITEPYLDGGETTLSQQLKTRSQVALTGKGTVLSQIDFVDKQSGVILNSFSQAIITSNGTTIAPSTYVTANMQLMCIERTI